MSPVPIRRVPTAPAAPVAVNFGDFEIYSGGFNIPEGNYALEHEVMMEPPPKEGVKRRRQTKPRLGVMVRFYNLDVEGAEPLEKFLSMGSKAADSFAPDPETGKRVIVLAGGAGGNLTNKSNWGLYLKSLYDSNMPKGAFTDDVSAIDGLWAHVQSIPAPEERKGFAQESKTGEAEEDEPRGSGLIPVVTEILDGGKPWENGGGLPGVEAPAPVHKLPARTAARPAFVPAKTAAKAPAPAPAEADGEELEVAAINGVAAAIEALVKGKKIMTKLVLKMETFKQIEDKEVATAVQDTYFADDAVLNGLLGQIDYQLAGGKIQHV